MSLGPDLRRRVLGAVATVPAPTRQALERRRGGWLAGGAVAALVVFALEGGPRPTSRELSLILVDSLGGLAIGGVAMWLLFTRGRRVLGRPAATLLTTAAVASVLFVAWRHGVSALWGSTRSWPERPGFRCLALGSATGAALLVGALGAWRRTVVATPAATAIAFGAGSGLGGALLVDLWCPVSYLPHLLLGHLLPIGILALLGGALGSRLLRLRRA